MVKVYVGNNAGRTAGMYAPSATLASILESKNIDYSRGMTTLDGSTLGAGDLSKTLADYGFDGSDGKNKCYLFNIAKTDNA